jgi:hypothetical protein
MGSGELSMPVLCAICAVYALTLINWMQLQSFEHIVLVALSPTYQSYYHKHIVIEHAQLSC